MVPSHPFSGRILLLECVAVVAGCIGGGCNVISMLVLRGIVSTAKGRAYPTSIARVICFIFLAKYKHTHI